MKKQIAAIILAGTMAVSTTPVYAESFLSSVTEMASEAMGGIDLSGLDLEGLLSGVDLDNFDPKKVDVDKILAAAKNNEFIKNLDVSTLNLQGVTDLLDNTDLLGKFGISAVDQEKLLSFLKDERVSDTITKLMSSAAKGESIKDNIKELLKNDTVKTFFSSITGGAQMSDVAAKLTGDNTKELISQVMKALFSAKSGESSEVTNVAQGLLQSGLGTLLGK